MSETSIPPHAVRVPIRSTGVAVSRLALGTAPLAGLHGHVSDAKAEATVARALSLGVTTFDTAPFYGAGRAESRLGRALRGVPRDAYVLSTKVGRVLVPSATTDRSLFQDATPGLRNEFDFTADGVRRSLDASLHRLGVDRVDIAYVHDPDDAVEQALGQAYPALADLRDQGVVRAIGVGMNQTRVPSRFIRETDIDVVLAAGRWSLLDRSAADELLPLAAERGVAVIVGGVFNSGLLADPRPGATFDYRPADPGLLARARALRDAAAAHGVPLAATALQHPLRHPAVTSVLVGARNAEELAADVDLFGRDVPSACWADIDRANAGHPAGRTP